MLRCINMHSFVQTDMCGVCVRVCGCVGDCDCVVLYDVYHDGKLKS